MDRSTVAAVGRGTKVIMADKASRIQVMFGLAFFALSLMSFTISVYSNSLVLSINGFVLLHRVLLCAGEAATKAMTSAVVTNGAEKDFSYGLGRFEVLAQFSSLAVLCFACVTATIEGLQHMFKEHDVHPVSVELLCLLHIAMVVFASIRLNREGYLRARRRGGKDVVLYFILECLGPITCFCSVNVVALTGMSRIDILLAMCLCVGTVLNAWEQLSKVSGILLLQAPLHLKPLLDKALREVAVIPGVLEVRDSKFWTLVEGHIVATLRLRLSSDASQTQVLLHVRQVMSTLVGTLTVQFEDANSSGSPGLAGTSGSGFTSHHHHNGHSSSCSHGHSHSHGGHGHSHGAEHHNVESQQLSGGQQAAAAAAYPDAVAAAPHPAFAHHGVNNNSLGGGNFPAAPTSSTAMTSGAGVGPSFSSLPPPPSSQMTTTELPPAPSGLGGMPPPPAPPASSFHHHTA